ncbi:chitinase, putative [Entamoeba dispar SAW760]|uniref:Chitinase domain-containing protein 1 n=1 Tax=Entamoeba dispar (strain ATCC PRA-260 / SAW760) TaxID=370354 RepID=B0EIG3_ENTDS|nr:chitinase, putative [Entamoeba dispar SAW760]EDR25692.1 chitinase, putative [Entamoeba dispar SAW760]|eukprot:EDR25692.1 chitinase, putative [Entamoeba dispar SAW760]
MWCIIFLFVIQYVNSLHPLMKQNLTKEDVLKYRTSEYSPKQFNGTLLTYITPWNLYGLNLLEKNKHKIDIVSPVLFTIQSYNGKNEIIGEDELQIVGYPRYTFNSITGDLKNVGKLIKEHCIKHSSICNGIMIDGIYTLYRYYKNEMGKQLVSMFEELKNFKIVIAIPPMSIFTEYEIELTKKYVELYVVMTYDYFYRGGIYNSPLSFIDSSMKYIKAKGPQFAIGINFYGYAHCKNKQPVVVDRKTYYDWVKLSTGPFKWNEPEKEHIFTVQDCMIDYPTLEYIKVRINYAIKNNFSIGIWELGQGLDYFMDIF